MYDLSYWGQYEITEEDLFKNRIFPAKEIHINGKYIKPLEHSKNNPTYVYLDKNIKGEEFIKTYKPYDKIYKWRNNWKSTYAPHIGNINNFNPSKIGIFIKSKKCQIVVNKILSEEYQCFDIFSENWVAPKNMLNVKYYFGDNDLPGLKAGIKYIKQGYIFKYIPRYYSVKDYSDFVKIYGLKKLKKLNLCKL